MSQDTIVAPVGVAAGAASPATPGGAKADEQRQLASVQASLVREFGDRLSAEQVEQQLQVSVRAFDGAPIRSFVPVLAQRSVRRELLRSLTSGS